MLAERIPYQIIGGMRFFERAEVKDLLSYLRVIDNPKSDVDLMRIINVPARKIGDTHAGEAGGGRRRAGHVDLRGARARGRGRLGAQAKNAVLRFRDLLQGLMRVKDELSPSELAEQVLDKSGYAEMLQADESAEAETRLQNLRELVGSILAYEEETANADEEATLSGYLEQVTLQSDVDALEETPRVAMMTVHAAKGLEFDTVFLTGMEEDLFPFRGMDPKRGDDQEEERRLAYVAVTRARRRLWITYAGRRAIFGTTRYGLASRFIGDLPRGSVRHEMTPALERRRRTDAAPTWATTAASRRGRGPRGSTRRSAAARGCAGAAAAAPARAPGERYVEREDAEPEAGEVFSIGARVEHKTFGVGVVQSVDRRRRPHGDREVLGLRAEVHQGALPPPRGPLSARSRAVALLPRNCARARYAVRTAPC